MQAHAKRMDMALAEAILVCLTDRPMTGYELAKAFDTTIGFFWHAGHQQIYRELQRLREARLVDGTDVVQTGKPNKTVYAVNGRGLAHLSDWSQAAHERPPLRDNMLVKLYALDHVDVAALRAEIGERLVQHKARLALYERIRAKRFSGRVATLRKAGWQLGLDLGLASERTHIAWCESALATLARLGPEPSPQRRGTKRAPA